MLIITTTKDKKEAKKIAKGLLKKELCACVSLFEIESLYRWNGKIEDENEYLVEIKTSDKNYKKVEKFIKKQHSYKTPQIVAIKLDKIEKRYKKWLKKESR